MIELTVTYGSGPAETYAILESTAQDLRQKIRDKKNTIIEFRDARGAHSCVNLFRANSLTFSRPGKENHGS